MEEEVKKEEVIKQPTMIESAKEQADRLERLNSELSAKIKILEEMKAFEALGGKSEGAKQVEKPKEIDPKDYAKAALMGQLPKKE